jgi:hypothetical protein
MTLEIQILAWDRHNNVAELPINQTPNPPLFITKLFFNILCIFFSGLIKK